MSRRILVLVAVAALAVSSFAEQTTRPVGGQQSAVGSGKVGGQQSAAGSRKVFRSTARQPTADRPTTTQPQAPAAAPATLEQAFAVAAESASIETEDGVMAMVGPIEVVVSRIGADGKPVMACVDNIEAAKRFFAAPVKTVTPKQDKEQ